MPAQPIYNALKGSELKALILKRADQLLENSGRFPAHITYPNVQFYLNIQIHLPVTSDRDFTLEKKVDESQLPANVPAEDVLLTGSIAESEFNPPDKIRDDNLMPVGVPEVTNFKNSGMVEVVEVPTVRGPKDATKSKVGEADSSVGVEVTQ